MLKEFKEFAMKGNLIDIAVGFVMGAAFSKIVTAFTKGIVSPIIGLIFKTDGLEKLKYVLKAGAPEVKDAAGNIVQAAVPESAIMYGSFLAALIDFIIVAFVMFMIVRSINRMKAKEEAAPAPPSTEEVLLTEIRDLLKNK